MIARFRKILLVAGTAFLFMSCDPAKLVILKNETTKPAHFRWTVRTDSADINGIRQFKTVMFDLGTSKNDSEKTLVFGLGNWSISEIERFVDEDIQSIEIESITKKIAMTDKKDIKNYLLERRHGILKNFITIKLK